ncbi:hypothetical protein [Candidatus Nephthysia bennettiae]|uniref:Uncharacterized protein n=1 Tax=Candidatus Nephthysia bennettiae TaxID=3127016 RepID=A0A934K1I4_9BACT|nr:hypothetical protein [Candidatus Dormibacteraeota bacterium]MBJ7613584.1 hypothetical protein [Candidatus Dormibacteraeota bacterium]
MSTAITPDRRRSWLARLLGHFARNQHQDAGWTPAENPLGDGMTPEAEACMNNVVRRARKEDGEILVYR